ncbi:MAG TPA: DEAD/DEAH box helicase [Verrucomicrobiae bacterium]|nr:DEAD/DEAH box helicase [Verrucomicrobiae bacterium]
MCEQLEQPPIDLVGLVEIMGRMAIRLSRLGGRSGDRSVNVLAPVHDWRTTDEDEINRRRVRAGTESFRIINSDARHRIFSNFRVNSGSGLNYQVEIRDVAGREFACDCVDFRINGLGTCKHVEAVLALLQARFPRELRRAQKGSTRMEIVPDRDGLRLSLRGQAVPKALREWFDTRGQFVHGAPEEAVASAQQCLEAGSVDLRVSQEVGPWLEARRRQEECRRLRREYEQKVQSGEWPVSETRVPLFPYQRDGMLHLAFTERALLADEMGLGKTIQAIAACALLHRLDKARRVLVVTPASLKTEWEEQIQKFAELPYQLVFGGKDARLRAYDLAGSELPGGQAPFFFTLVNYEQMLGDSLEVNARLRPDVVVLDEAQRIKNWNTKTSRAVKRLRSRYAFVLTGTPIENRIDELHSLMDYLDPTVLGPLFRFNREFYELNERGRPSGYRQLDKLHARIRPSMLRRRKADVETELPDRTERNHFVPLSNQQQLAYEDHEAIVARLAATAKRRPLTQQEQEKLLRELAMMRMICDTNYILDPEERECPKLGELETILEECRENPEVKVIIFSEWERMLQLVRELCEQLKLGYAWHTGSVPQRRRRGEINAFKTDPNCRVFLSTESGAAGLNLQVASVVINCDLPWNPARLEQRIARAWRKFQTRPVTIINLVSENTIEHRMLSTLADKQSLADGVLDRRGNLNEIKLRSGQQAFLKRLNQLMSGRPGVSAHDVERALHQPVLPADRAAGFAQAVAQQINGALVRCEERYPKEAPHSVVYVVVDRDAPLWRERLAALQDRFFGVGHCDPLSPVQLEVLDRATDEAIQRLAGSGLLSLTTRATRPLWPVEPADTTPAPLSPADLEKANSFRQQSARRLKMARLLGEGDLTEETRAPLLEAMHLWARARALESRLPEPAQVEEILLPPTSALWVDKVPVFRAFLAGDLAGWTAVADALSLP